MASRSGSAGAWPLSHTQIWRQEESTAPDLEKCLNFVIKDDEAGCESKRKMKKKFIWATVAVAAAGIATAAYLGWFAGRGNAPDADTPGAGKRGPWSGGRPMPVQAATVRRGDIDVTVDALGTVSALNTAVVKARVSGQLVKIAFREGQLVKAGDLLAEIDPRPFQATYDQAAGQLARDEALLTNARLDLERYRGLLKKDSIPGQQVDTQESLVRQYEGTVKNDRGLVDNARLQLAFCRITAPISGRLGLRQVDVGNYVQTSDTNGIAVITQTQPINVVFAIPADKLTPVISRLHGGERLKVEAFDRDNKTLLATGRLASIDNQIDIATGTVKLKAEFVNRDERLFPNQFVNVRLGIETRQNAILAPTAAIQRGAKGTFVYVVGKDGSVAVRPVNLGPTDGEIIAVEQGLEAEEQVVIDGADKLREGAKVTVATPGAGKRGDGNNGADTGSNEYRGSPEDRQKRWAEMNARIDRGEFGEEIKKLPEEERKKRMRELRAQREGNGKAQ